MKANYLAGEQDHGCKSQQSDKSRQFHGEIQHDGILTEGNDRTV